MKIFRSKLTYANVMSSIAVFLVLGGATAFAATTVGKNSVGAKQLKKNAVTTTKLKNGSVTGAKLMNGSVTGAKISLPTLGTVPSATNASHASSADTATNANHASTADSATNATNATNAVNATNATNFSRYFTTGIVRAGGGQTVTLFSKGPFTFSGHCVDLGSGEFEAFTTISTTQANSSYGNAEEYRYEANFEPGEELSVNYDVSNTTPESNIYYPSYYGGFEADSADGSTMLSGEMFAGVHYYGASCAFWGHGFSNGS